MKDGIERDAVAPLHDIRVIELCNLAAGPWTTMLLADLGADVVKVESPTGDLSRGMGRVHVGGESALFIACNRQKRSIRLDLKKQRGVEVFRQLASTADVVVQNLRPGVVQRLGVDYDTLRLLNPRVIYSSISAYGQSGPYASRAANDPIIQAFSGMMGVTGTPEEPALVGAPVPDYATAALMAFGIMVALRERERSGAGQHIEASLVQATVAMLSQRYQEYLMTGHEQPRFGSGHSSFAPYQCFRTRDGEFLYVAVIHDRFWRNLCLATNRSDLLEDERFSDNTGRVRHRTELTHTFDEVFGSRTLDDWVDILVAADVPCSPVNGVARALADPQMASLDPFVELEHSQLGTLKTFGFPLSFSSSPVQIERQPPALGADTDEVLRQFGFSDSEIRQLREDGVC